MVTRSRSKSQDFPEGTYKYYYGQSNEIVNVLDSNRSVDTITDEVIFGNNGDLYVDHRSQPNLPFYTSEGTYLGNPARYDNCPPARIRYLDWEMQHNTPVGLPTLAQATTTLLKETNPSREIVNLPVFIWELKKLPMLLINRTKDLSDDLARGRLSLEYGWKPFVRDLIKIWNIQDGVAKRIRELKDLNRSGLRRKRELYRGSLVNQGTALLSTGGMRVEALMVRSTSVIRYGHVVWKFDPTSLPFGSPMDVPPPPELVAWMSALSLNASDPSMLYEAIPFSWLADWVSNLGDYLHATRNYVGAVPHKIAIMTYSKTEVNTRLSGSGSMWPQRQVVAGSETFLRTRETKERKKTTATVEAHYPFLSERQVQILGDVVKTQFGSKLRKR